MQNAAIDSASQYGEPMDKKEKLMNRRDFLKLSAAGVATLVLSSRIPGLGIRDAFGATPVLNVTITDAVKDMVTHNSINSAQCYFWIYKMTAVDANGVSVDVPADCPGPTIVMVNGDKVDISITNALDEPHSFFIPGRLPSDPPIFDSGPINPGQTVAGSFTVTQSGAFLYYDNLNEPVNRVMGLHGALVVRPSAPVGANKFTPYDNPTPHVQNMYNEFGNSPHWPGMAWEDADPLTNTPAFRQYVWLTHQASPNLFAEVGNLSAGTLYDPKRFMDAFLRDPFSPTRNNRIPQYFTINGQSGFFSHFSPAITPMGRVGEPVVIHILSAGLWTHSMHLHANHFYVTSSNGVVSANPIWVDVYTVKPMDRIDYTIPYMRPPDTGNVRGIGYPDAPLVGITSGQPTWPPVEEFDVYMPAIGETLALIPPPTNQAGVPIDLAQRQSPLCYPMHDHSEPSQTAQGGNYNCGLIAGIYFVGDRNAQSQGLGNHMNFPMDADFAMMFRNIRGIDNTVQAFPAPGPRPV